MCIKEKSPCKAEVQRERVHEVAKDQQEDLNLHGAEYALRRVPPVRNIHLL